MLGGVDLDGDELTVIVDLQADTAAFALGQLFEHPKITQQRLTALARAGGPVS